MVGGWGAGEGAQGKIKGHRAKWLLSHCLHIVFWGSAQNRGVLRFCVKPAVYVGLMGALFIFLLKNCQNAAYLCCVRRP